MQTGMFDLIRLGIRILNRFSLTGLLFLAREILIVVLRNLVRRKTNTISVVTPWARVLKTARKRSLKVQPPILTFIGEEDSAENFKSAPKNAYSPKVTKILMKWLKNNIYYPYPSEDERIRLWRETGLSRKQLRVWLINTRKVSLNKHLLP
jgi:hypothetical protein